MRAFMWLPAYVSWPIVTSVALLFAFAAKLLPNYHLFIVGQLAVVIIVAISLTLLMGGVGIFALSSAAFMAIGAYGVIIATTNLGLPILLSVPVVVLFAAALGGLLGLVALRLSGFYLAIATLGFLQVLQVYLKQGGSLTGDGYGLIVPDFELPFRIAPTTELLAAISVFVLILVIWCSACLMKSRYGRAWLALKDNESAAQMQGINVRRMKMVAFAFTSGLASLSGIFHVFLIGVANPSAYTVNLSIFHTTLVVVGGMTGSIVGAIISPIVLFWLPEVFHALGEWRDFFYGALLLLTLCFLPSGIAPAIQAGWRRVFGLGAPQP